MPTRPSQRAAQGRPKGGVVLLQEVWGLSNWIRSEVDRYAREGYDCIAPATMDAWEYGFESENYSSDHFASVAQLMKAFDPAKAVIDIEAAVEMASVVRGQGRRHRAIASVAR